jgi:hypothetical protein
LDAGGTQQFQDAIFERYGKDLRQLYWFFAATIYTGQRMRVNPSDLIDEVVDRL